MDLFGLFLFCSQSGKAIYYSKGAIIQGKNVSGRPAATGDPGWSIAGIPGTAATIGR